MTLESHFVNAHSNAFDAALFIQRPSPVESTGGDPNPSPRRTWVIPHVLEKSGRVTLPTNSDTQILVTYSGGRSGMPTSTGATVYVYLYDEAGKPLRGNSADVCNPCTYSLSPSTPKLQLNLENVIIANGGGLTALTVPGFAVVTAQGDAANINVMGFIMNSHSGPLDLSVFGFEPQMLEESRAVPFPVTITRPLAGTTLSFPTLATYSYVVEAAASLNGEWTQLQVVAGDGSTKLVVDTAVAPGGRFYRVRVF